MKKKIICLLTIFTLMIFVGIKEVNSAGETHELIYDIENFNVDKDSITFEGWALITNFHNDGGRNTIITITAKSGNKNVVGKTNYNGDKNSSLYEANCIKYSGVNGSCVEKHDTATCDPKNSSSSCRYDNVGFKVTFSINDLLSKIGKEKTIAFELKVITQGQTKTSSIAVSSLASNVKDGSNINGTNATIKISGISNTAKISVNSARVRASTNDMYAWGGGFYWKKNVSYDINDIKNSTNPKFNNLKMYELKYNINKTGECKKGADNGLYGCITGNAVKGNDNKGWAYASWLRVDGNVKITLEDPNVETKCDREEGSGPDKLDCNATDVEFKQTINGTVTASRTITSGNEYNKYWKSDEYEKYLGDKYCTNELTQYITGEVSITQIGNAKFDLSPKTIYSGGGFYFESSYAGNASYKLCSELAYKIVQYQNAPSCPSITVGRDQEYDSLLSADGKTCYYTIYEWEEPENCENENSTDEENENSTDEENENSCGSWIVVGTETGNSKKNCKKITDTYYCSNGSAWTEGCNEDSDGDNVYSEAMQTFAKAMSDKYLQNPKSAENAQTLSEDSNDEKKNEANQSMGIWTVTEKNLPNKWYPEEENQATYKIEFKPWLSCINVRTAEVDYFPYIEGDDCEKHETNEVAYIDGERLYYIPIKEETHIFPVKVDINEVSIIEKMNWHLQYECGVECQQKLYNEYGSFKFIYRPINMSNPFPDRTPGNNWQSFMNDYQANEKNVINKLTRNNLEYSVTLTPELISDITKYNKNAKQSNEHYTSLKTIDDKGFSYFLNKYGIGIELDNNYNKLGECTNDCWQALQGDDGF